MDSKSSARALREHPTEVAPPAWAHHPAGGPRPDGEPLRFLFTIDTEISMGGALLSPALRPVGADRRIWGETKRGHHGIERFMDTFEEFGMRGVFFFEVCGRNIVEPTSLQEAAHAIAERGHDVELHVHPEFRMNLEAVRKYVRKKPTARFYRYGHEAQREILELNASLLERWTGRRPVAFRAGGFCMDERATDALAAQAMAVDSSFNRWAIQYGTCKFPQGPALNDVALLENGVFEVPVTCIRSRGLRGGLRPFDPASLSAAEMAGALEDMYRRRMRACCSVTHSFRLVRTTDIQYADARPDRINLRRLRGLCRFLASHRDRFEVCTFRTLPLERWRTELAGHPVSEPEFPEPPMWASLTRLAVQSIKDRRAI